MAPLTYKRRRRTGPLNEDQRAQAIKRIRDEASVRSKLGSARAIRDARKARDPVAQDRPEDQRRKAEKIREKRNGEREITSHGGAVAAPRAGGAKPRHMTTRGPRRLSFAEAYSRRTTDTSRQRVLDLYGRSKPPAAGKTRPGGPSGAFGTGGIKAPLPGQNGSRRIHKPVSPLEQAAQMRAKVQRPPGSSKRNLRPRRRANSGRRTIGRPGAWF
jgi:hypothetical protein